ncbi:hypothetical protein G9A89_003554 [Geosiphon pyriformis]|nr:hypothetical protein G9A89_003554 [Geosiphon pyriformis]
MTKFHTDIKAMALAIRLRNRARMRTRPGIPSEFLIPNESLTDQNVNPKKFSFPGKRTVVDPTFQWNAKKPIFQLILFWETVTVFGSNIARKCAGWA